MIRVGLRREKIQSQVETQQVAEVEAAADRERPASQAGTPIADKNHDPEPGHGRDRQHRRQVEPERQPVAQEQGITQGKQQPPGSGGSERPGERQEFQEGDSEKDRHCRVDPGRTRRQSRHHDDDEDHRAAHPKDHIRGLPRPRSDAAGLGVSGLDWRPPAGHRTGARGDDTRRAPDRDRPRRNPATVSAC